MSNKMIFAGGILLLWISLSICWGLSRQPSEDQAEPEQTQSKLDQTQSDHDQILREPEQILTENSSNPAKDMNETNIFDHTIDSADTTDISEEKGDTLMAIGQNDLVSFYYQEISEEIKSRIKGKSYKDNDEIPLSDLRYVKVLYWGFDNETHEGELIVNKAIAEDIIEIFKELYEIKYPIERMILVDEYDADDNTSMAANNSSAFNYRNIDGTDRISVHSYGLAIDINPLYNPYVRYRDGKEIVTPVNGIEYADRELDCPYYIKACDPLYEAFVKRGFTWGGEWKNSKDYQHFEKKLD